MGEMDANATEKPDCKRNMESGSELDGEKQPAVVIYRSVKYNGFLHRTMQYISTYSRFYFLEPIISSFNEFRQLLYEILGFFCIFISAPFLLAFFLVLCFVRSLRTNLVRLFYPKAVICEDWLPRCILLGKSLGMVTAVVWVRGKVDVDHLSQHFQIPCLATDSILNKKQSDKFGVRVWLESPVPFDIKNHIIGAPNKFYNVPITDSEGSGSKSALQKYVTSCVSQKLHQDMSPWRIYVIPQSVTEKQRTCCVLRFHYILLNDPGVRKAVDDLFMQKLILQENTLKLEGHNISDTSFRKVNANGHMSSTCNSAIQVDLEEAFNTRQNAENGGKVAESEGEPVEFVGCPEENVLDEPLKTIVNFRKTLFGRLTTWINKNLLLTHSDFRSWMVLRKKQIGFHTKKDLPKVAVLEFIAKLQVVIIFFGKLPHNKIWMDLKDAIAAAFLIFRACCSIPVEIIDCTFFRNSPRRNGFCKVAKLATRQISWSEPISIDLIETIKEKTDCSLESIVLTACALALKFYYLETSLPNPKTVGVAAPSLTCDLLSLTGFRNFDLPTSDFNIPYQLRKIHSVLSEYPTWKLMGMYYVFKYISRFLPRSLAYIIIRKFMKRYPLTFNFLNLESPLPVLLPHISLWGRTVDEVTFWRTPQSDFCVSATLVKYGGMIKLSVLSPMKSVDTALTQKFASHLNSIAEAVGVEKYKIPYSRKTSPASTVCSSPSIFKSSF